MLKIILTNAGGSYDVTQLVSAVTWSGDVRQIARTLTIRLLAEGAPDAPVGTAVTMEDGGTRLFTGYVFTRSRSTGSPAMDLTCHDPGIYLSRTQVTKKYQDIAPEAAAAALCGEWGIPVGPLAPTGTTVSRLFFGVSLYQVIATLYTLAGRQTGKTYHLGFSGTGAFTVTEQEALSPVVLIQPGSNLMEASVAEEGGSIVNRVEIYDQYETLLSTKEDAASIASFGALQSVLKQAKDQDASAQAEKLLEQSQPVQRITLQALGDARCIAGGAVMVREPVSGLSGLFWIDSDTHQWKNGLHTSRLVVRLKAVMNEQEAGRTLGQ